MGQILGTEMENQLSLWTKEDQTALNYHENVIEHGLQALVDTAMSLRHIRDNRLYRNGYSTFEEYCFQRWGRKRRWAYHLINAALVVDNLNVHHGAQMPETERQIRPLTKLDTPEQQVEAWSNAVANSKTGKPTAKEVNQEVERLKADVKALEQRNKDLAMVVKTERSSKEQVAAAKDQLALKLEETEKELGAIAETKNREFQKTLSEEIEKATSDLEKTIEERDKAIEKQKAEFQRFKKNPDPETNRKIKECNDALAKLEGDRRQAEAKLNKLRTQDDHARTNAIKVNRLKGAVEKVIADHADGVVALSSPYMTESLLCDAEALAHALRDMAVRIENSIDASRQGMKDQGQTIDVTIV